MVTLKLALDATGMRTGGAEAGSVLDGITNKAQRTGSALDLYLGVAAEKSFDRATASTLKFGKAIEAVGEVNQVGARVRLLGEEVRNLGSGFGSASSVAQTFAGALIDVAQVVQKTEGSLGGFAAALRANPILAAAGVISLIASAMSLFGGETEKTTEKIRAQVDALEELRRAGQTLQERIRTDDELGRAGFGVDTARSAEDRARLLAEQISRLRNPGAQQRFLFGSELQNITGLSTDELARRAPQGSVGFAPLLDSQRSRIPFTISNEGLQSVLRELAVELRRTAQAGTDLAVPRFGATPYGPPAPPGGVQTISAPSNLFPNVIPITGGVGYGSAIGPQLGEESPFSRIARENQIQDAAAQLAEFNDRLAQTRALGVEVGNALGNSFFAFLQNANNARGVLVGLLQQLSQIAQAQVVRGFASQIGNLFGSTVAQQTATTNANMPPGSFGPQQAP